MLKTILFSYMLLLPWNLQAKENRDLLQKAATQELLTKQLITGQKWVPYPAYSDREGWNKLTGAHKAKLIADGEASLGYEWKVVKATDFLEYRRSGSRTIMENPFGANNTALNQLVLAELAEGKGRFIDQIINGVWSACELSTWVLSAHLPGATLPDVEKPVIDLTAGDLGSFLSWTYFLLKEPIDKVDPVITKRLRQNIQDRVLDPYMERNDFWWQAINLKPGELVNNWNPWCNFNVLACYMLLENDPQRLTQAVYKSMISVDQFINYNHEDGACEEGPSYWGHAAGKLYDYLALLSLATGGKVTIFDKPIIKNLGEYIANSYIGDGWVVNFADASAKGGGPSGVIYRYGKAVNSQSMMQFAAYLAKKDSKTGHINEGRDIFRTFENLRTSEELASTPAMTTSGRNYWYPETQFCYMRNGDFFFGAKGGHNNESHNHNDVGSFILYYKNQPLFIDAGVGTYTRQTFSKERYSIWTMQSDYHNLPKINGISQTNGPEYHAKDVQYEPSRQTLRMDISEAYPKGTARSWIRTYSMGNSKKADLLISDHFSLEQAQTPNIITFMTAGKPLLSRPGILSLNVSGETLELRYDAKQFTALVEVVEQTDPRLNRIWGSALYRVLLKANQVKGTDKYEFAIKKVE